MNKKEQQRLIKEQKQQESLQREQTRKILIKVGFFVGVPVLAILLIYAVLSQGTTYSPIEIVETDHVRGNIDSPVTITVYADFECPACATEDDLMSRAWPSISDKARLVFRHYPVTATHPNAWSASQYAEAAGKQGKFWEMHDLLFQNQGVWAALGNPDDEFDSYATALALDLEQLHQDLRSDEVIQKIRSDQRGGTQSGVRATPTLFINGAIVSVSTVSRLVELVESAYSEATGS